MCGNESRNWWSLYQKELLNGEESNLDIFWEIRVCEHQWKAKQHILCLQIECYKVFEKERSLRGPLGKAAERLKFSSRWEGKRNNSSRGDFGHLQEVTVIVSEVGMLWHYWCTSFGVVEISHNTRAWSFLKRKPDTMRWDYLASWSVSHEAYEDVSIWGAEQILRTDLEGCFLYIGIVYVYYQLCAGSCCCLTLKSYNALC